MAERNRSLKAARTFLGFSQRHLAAAIGISQASVSYYESGMYMPSKRMARKIAKILDVEPDILFKETQNENH